MEYTVDKMFFPMMMEKLDNIRKLEFDHEFQLKGTNAMLNDAIKFKLNTGDKIAINEQLIFTVAVVEKIDLFTYESLPNIKVRVLCIRDASFLNKSIEKRFNNAKAQFLQNPQWSKYQYDGKTQRSLMVFYEKYVEEFNVPYTYILGIDQHDVLKLKLTQKR